ncbi:UNKNOWN [Stylonychia lemnae]|uniref:Uncharacterized protein n=1 Tax=Stylonychia lemnae TaxID=5949 RepID=A0A078AAN6_STYLE|nr:UNKNOWN [Stylonychia lemnae]|eukprot:CDW79279.1 UNKNOWN [Stylonychia lemnae]
MIQSTINSIQNKRRTTARQCSAMLSSNFFNEQNENSSQDSNDSTTDSQFNINDPIVKALVSRDFPMTVKENAAIQELYQSINKLFSIKKCLIGLGRHLSSSQGDKIVSYYPLIEYEVIQRERIKEEAVIIAIDDSQDDEQENINLNSNMQNSDQKMIQSENEVQNQNDQQQNIQQIIVKKIRILADNIDKKSKKTSKQQNSFTAKYQQTSLLKSSFVKLKQTNLNDVASCVQSPSCSQSKLEDQEFKPIKEIDPLDEFYHTPQKIQTSGKNTRSKSPSRAVAEGLNTAINAAINENELISERILLKHEKQILNVNSKTQKDWQICKKSGFSNSTMNGTTDPNIGIQDEDSMMEVSFV